MRGSLDLKPHTPNQALAKGGEGLPTIEALKKEKEELARQADEAMAQLKVKKQTNVSKPGEGRKREAGPCTKTKSPNPTQELRTELELARERGAKEGVIEGGVSSLEEQSLRVKEVQLQVQRVEQVMMQSFPLFYFPAPWQSLSLVFSPPSSPPPPRTHTRTRSFSHSLTALASTHFPRRRLSSRPAQRPRRTRPTTSRYRWPLRNRRGRVPSESSMRHRAVLMS